MIAAWGVCLTILTNLHYFGTMVGGMLTAALLVQLANRRMWSMALMIAGVSVAAAAPALVIGALQSYFTPRGFMSWYTTTFSESVKLSLHMVAAAAAKNLAAVACAFVTCLFIVEDKRKWIELRTPVMLLGMIAIFLGAIILANIISPLMVGRYLIAGAGAVTFAVAILAASRGSPVWLPAAASVIALLLQANFLYTTLGSIENSGWLQSVRAVAKLKSECAMTKILVHDRADELGPGGGIRHRVDAVGYGYYARRFGFSYEYVRPGAIISGSGPCPSVIWIEELNFLEDNAFEMLNQLGISKIGVAELQEYPDQGTLIIVR
jgi:hypothetical protein